jgi:DNA repair exonuclease SbcCD ATPase subunit
MITYHVVRWKNFLSTGNAWTEIKLDAFPNVLFVGDNGSGKSTILDALTFGLFGKAFRNINKPKLCNSINQKNCVVEIEFSTNNKRYKVVRGLKPAIFEIHCDGVFLNQDSATKDYQEYLEKFILRKGYKAFIQIVILGSASYTPFMSLTPADRRLVIEDLLDIQVFSVMNNIVKQRLQSNKEALEINRVQGMSLESQHSFILKTIDSLKQDNEKRRKALSDQLKVLLAEVEALEAEIKKLRERRDDLTTRTAPYKALNNKHTELIRIKSQIEAKRDRNKADIDYLLQLDVCPTCKQEFDERHRKAQVGKLTAEAETLREGLKDIKTLIDECVEQISYLSNLLQEYEGVRHEITAKETAQNSHQANAKKLREQINDLTDADKTMTASQDELARVESEIETIKATKKELTTERLYIDTALVLLKDGGIKTKILKQYLPVINQQINKHLKQMGFFVSFEINENFEETIKSRFLDDFSYENFSEGEKTRINLAILFAWRSIARMRNSINTNLLIFDEILDGSLDANGIDEFLKIMWALRDTNVIVISHKQDMLVDKFKRVVKFQRKRNFSTAA